MITSTGTTTSTSPTKSKPQDPKIEPPKADIRSPNKKLTGNVGNYQTEEKSSSKILTKLESSI